MTTNYAGNTNTLNVYNSGNTGAVTIGIPDWNVTLNTSVSLVVDESQIIATEAILKMKVSEFGSLFSQNADQIVFASGAPAVLKSAMRRQSIYFSEWGHSGVGGFDEPAITDSFLVQNSVLQANDTNIFEYNLLKNSYEKFGFKDAFIAFTSGSRLASLTESVGMSQKALSVITDFTKGFAPAVAQKIYLDVLSERTSGLDGYNAFPDGVTGATGAAGGVPSNIFQIGDRFTFAVTCKPPNSNPEFIQQIFRCIIQLIGENDSAIVPAPYHVGNLRVVSDSDYVNAYANAVTTYASAPTASASDPYNHGIIIS